MVNVRIAAIITACGLLTWNLIAIGSVASSQEIFAIIQWLPFITPRFPWENQDPVSLSITIAPSFPIIFWFLVVSWSGAWLMVFTVKYLVPHARLEADQLAYVGAILAMFPFALPAIPLFYLRLRKAAEKVREEPEI